MNLTPFALFVYIDNDDNLSTMASILSRHVLCGMKGYALGQEIKLDWKKDDGYEPGKIAFTTRSPIAKTLLDKLVKSEMDRILQASKNEFKTSTTEEENTKPFSPNVHWFWGHLEQVV